MPWFTRVAAHFVWTPHHLIQCVWFLRQCSVYGNVHTVTTRGDPRLVSGVNEPFLAFPIHCNISVRTHLKFSVHVASGCGSGRSVKVHDVAIYFQFCWWRHACSKSARQKGRVFIHSDRLTRGNTDFIPWRIFKPTYQDTKWTGWSLLSTIALFPLNYV